MQEFVPQLAFETGAVRFGIFSAITSRRVLFDAASLGADTDRATDVVEPTSFRSESIS
jgi:hypothetical protein